MASEVDDTKPTAGSASTANVRANFTALKDEINELHWATEDAVTAGGTVDALTANFTNDVTLAEGVTIVVKAAGANTSATPTLDVDGTGAKTIVKDSGAVLEVGDIAGSRHYLLLRYDATNTVWVLLNPAVNSYAVQRANHTGTQAQSTVTNLVSDLASKVDATDSLDRGYITGLIPSLSTDADHDITISVGECRDSTDSDDIRLTSTITKQIDAVWAAGDNVGGLFTGTVAANTTYHMFVIKKDSDGSIDAGFDTSITAANIPAGYTAFRRVFSFITNSSSNIKSFFAIEQGRDLEVTYDSRSSDFASSSPGTAANLVTLTVPTGLSVIAKLSFDAVHNSDANFLITAVSQTNATPSASVRDLATAASSQVANTELQRVTDTSGRVRLRSSVATTVGTVRLSITGYKDNRS